MSSTCSAARRLRYSTSATTSSRTASARAFPRPPATGTAACSTTAIRCSLSPSWQTPSPPRRIPTSSKRGRDSPASAVCDSACGLRSSRLNRATKASPAMVRPLYFAVLFAALITAACGSNHNAHQSSTTRPVIFVGLDAADWQLLDDYIAKGSMPNLGRLVNEGTSGVLETIRPPLSPLVWTTMMTGVSPLEHGILDFAQFDPKTGAKEPITSSSRRVPAIWNMASSQGKRVGVIGLWATYPAEPVNGTIVSDRLFTFLFNQDAPPAGVVSPPDRDSWARDMLKRANDQIDESAVKAYLPWLTHDEYVRNADARDPYAQPISALRRILIDTQVYDSLGRDIVATQKPDLGIVYFEGTDTIGHVFAPFAPPKQPQVSDADYERYHDVPERYFRHIDEVLGAYRQLAEASNAVLMLASDHGFLWKEGRPTAFSSNATSTAAKWHRSDGMYVIWGPGIAASNGHTAKGSVQ